MNIKANVRSELSEIVFFLGMLVVLGIFLVQSFSLRKAAATIPQYVIYGTMLIILINLLITIVPEVVPDFITQDKSESGAIAEAESENVNVSKIDGHGLVREFIWVVAYVLGMEYVGFFTASVLFVFLYIFVKDESLTGVRKYVVPALWSLVINSFLYILFVELLKVSSVFQLGFTL